MSEEGGSGWQRAVGTAVSAVEPELPRYQEFMPDLRHILGALCSPPPSLPPRTRYLNRAPSYPALFAINNHFNISFCCYARAAAGRARLFRGKRNSFFIRTLGYAPPQHSHKVFMPRRVPRVQGERGTRASIFSFFFFFFVSCFSSRSRRLARGTKSLMLLNFNR